MRENPSITYAELTSSLGINTSAVQKLVKRIFFPPLVYRVIHII